MKKSFIAVLLFFFILQIAYAALRDPTRPADYLQKKEGVTTQTLQLNAVLISADRKIAVINGQYLGIGGEIAGNHVVDIQSDAVQLDGPSGRITLLLFGKSIKRESTSTK